ncbi:MAG: helix-turn-helix domain-containing protein [Ilumatobacter sp.]|uniref:helix-turn-helix domain-containing protein n=1 Tax=Ilumatobacter sp. TaxID=1967498 RepID=UPI00391AD96B
MIRETTLRQGGVERPMLGIPQLAERLGTTERFVRRLVCERRIPFHKVGKYVRFDQDDVDDWVAHRRIDALR